MLRFALLLFFAIQISWFSGAQTPEKIKSNEDAIREQMILISKQLGVTCNHCHNTDNFRSDKMPTFKVALEHMKLTQLLIDNGLNGRTAQKADCYMCHRGQAKPPK